MEDVVDMEDDDDDAFDDGALPHVLCLNMNTLRAKFGNSLISRNSPVKRPPRSCDLTPPAYFLRPYIESKVYANQPALIEELKENNRLSDIFFITKKTKTHFDHI